MSIIPVKTIAKALGKDVEQAAKPMPDLLPDPVIPEADLAAIRAADARDASVQDKIPEEEITVFHGTPSEFPAVSEVVSLKTGERVLVDKKQYPDWTQHPDLEPADYEFVADHELGAFDSSKIGTGEGAQAFGHGLYFAERKGTAESYQKGLAKGAQIDGGKPAIGFDVEDYSADYFDGKPSFSGSSPRGILLQKVKELKQSGEPVREAALKEIDQRIKEVEGVEGGNANDRLLGLKDLRKLVEEEDLSKFKYEKGSLYEVKIKAKQEEFLDLDELIGEQDQPFVERVFESNPKLKGLIEDAEDYYTPGGENATGFSVLRMLQESFEPQEYADILNKAGIKGFKYKDAQTRFSKKGATYNYVVFDDKIVDIAKKYGVSLFAAGSISLGIMTPQQAQAEVNPIGAPRPQPGTPEATADDTGSDYIEAREKADLTPGQLAVQQRSARRAQSEDNPAPVTERTTGEKAVAVAKDIGEGVIETPRAILGGFLKATQEAGEALEAIFGQLPTAGEDYEPISIDDPESTTGQLVQGVSQFLTAFFPALRGAKAIGLVKSAPYAAGFVADAFAFDPQEARLSDLVQQYPTLQNPVTEYLQSDPNDSRAEGMLKNGLEGLGLGGLTDALFKVVKVVKGNKNVKAQAEAAGETVEEFVGPKLPEFVGPDAPPIKENQSLVPTGKMPDEPEYIPFDEIADEASIEIPSPVKGGKGDAPDKAAKNINLNRLETTDEVKELLDTVAEGDSLDINAARREQITQQETEALANDLGMTVDELLARKGGEAFNAEQAVAARRLLVASGENLMKLANVAKDGGDMAIAVARRAMAQHRAIQLQVSGMTAEAGRALQSFRILAGSGEEQLKAIKEAIDASGGLDVNQEIFRKMSEINDAADLGRYVKGTYVATKSDMVQEVWINSLLSGLGTHVMNITSNSSVIVLSILERKTAGIFGKEIANGEANAMAMGILEGARDGFKLAKKAFKTGEPSDQLQKQEVAQQRAITAEQLNVSGAVGRGVDFLGNVVRTPGRALLASDEFFKAVAYRMELQAQAYRKAINEGLEGDEFVARVQGILENPPSDIRMKSQDFARYQTFTNELGSMGKAGQKWRNKAGIYGTIIAPFIRTPINVVKFALARGPLAPLMPSVRADILAGGARKELALARIGLGGMFMTISGIMAHNGQITGAGPTNYDQRRILEMSGWKPNSILIGDTYVSLERADPIAQILLMSANLVEVFAQVDDENTKLEAATAGMITVANSLTSRTFYNGIIDFVDAYASASRNPDDKQNSVIKWAERLGSTVVPSAVAASARSQDPTLRLTNGLVDKIKSRIPGYSKDLPPRRNMFGQPIVLEGGLGPDIASPWYAPAAALNVIGMGFYKSTKKNNAVVDEMIKEKITPGMPRRTIEGVELTTVQYDRFVQLSAGMEGRPSIEDALSATMSSAFYKRATSGEGGLKGKILTGVINDYRRQALGPLLEEFPQLKSDIGKANVEKEEALTGREVPEAVQARMGILPGDRINRVD